MIRRTARLRKEYLYRKSLEEKERILSDRKQRLKDALETGKPIPSDLRGPSAQKLAQKLDLDDEKNRETADHIDDEYAYAGEFDIFTFS